MINFGIVTKRTILIFIVLSVVFTVFVSVVTGNMRATNNDKLLQYQKSLKIDSNDMFEYAINTNVGNIMAYGKVKSIGYVEDSYIKGQYMYIDRKEEHYVRKTRQVPVTIGKTTTYRTEVYYEWDFYNRDYFKVTDYEFLGKKFKFDELKTNYTQYIDTVKFTSNKRYVYNATPLEFMGTLKSYVSTNKLSNNTFYVNKKHDVVIKSVETDDTTISVFAALIWLFGLVIIFASICVIEDWIEN